MNDNINAPFPLCEQMYSIGIAIESGLKKVQNKIQFTNIKAQNSDKYLMSLFLYYYSYMK